MPPGVKRQWPRMSGFCEPLFPVLDKPIRHRFLTAVVAFTLIAALADGEAKAASAKVERADALTALLKRMRPGEWINVPNSQMSRVVWDCREAPCPGNGPLASAIEGNTGPSAIMAAWSGGVLDESTDSLIVWGGGHQDYYGNSVYAFNLPTLTWSRLTTPSPISGWNQSTPILPDGSPSAMHTYDSLVMLPNGQMLAVGSQGATPNGNSYPQSWLFNPKTSRWTQAASYSGAAVDGIAAYNSANGKVYAINNSIGLQSYDYTTNKWAMVGPRPLADYHMVGAIDSNDNIMVAVGAGHLQAVNLSLGLITDITSSGVQNAQKGNAPGFVWVPSANLFVAWNGGSAIYTLDPHSWQWVARPAAEGNKVVPTAPAANGTFGRFQYDAAYDVFVVVNDINQDVYIYKSDFDRSRSP